MLRSGLYNVNTVVAMQKCKELSDKIETEREQLIEILKRYEPKEVAEYEIDRCLYALRTVGCNNDYFDKRVDKISVFLPSNLPLYSLILFGIIPSFTTKSLTLKPNSHMQDTKIIDDIEKVLNLQSKFSNMSIQYLDASSFVDKNAKDSDIVIFTGYAKNRDKILQQMKKESLLIFNGAGHNPLVVEKDADLAKAVKDSVFVKFFNSGQDCAGPDAILLHKDIANDFVQMFRAEVERLKVGKYSEDATQVGPIVRREELQKHLNTIYLNAPDDIVSGGSINVRERIVDPTVVARHITKGANYTEMFGPIAFLHTYDNDEQLMSYFTDSKGEYLRNKMYVSLYGTNALLQSVDDARLNGRNGVGIILHNQTIHDYERADKEYGGYSLGASGIVHKDQNGKLTTNPMPIYVPHIVSDFAKTKALEVIKNRKFALQKIGLENQLALEFKDGVSKIFRDNLSFAFIFGSTADGSARRNVANASDIDTFVCLKESNVEQEKEFNKFIWKLHMKYGFSPDIDYPSEIVSRDQLLDSISNFEKQSLNTRSGSADQFDSAIWCAALSSKKLGFIGDAKFASSLAKRSVTALTNKSKTLIDALQEDRVASDKLLLDKELHSKQAYDAELLKLEELHKNKKYHKVIDGISPFNKELQTRDDLDLHKKQYYQKKFTSSRRSLEL